MVEEDRGRGEVLQEVPFEEAGPLAATTPVPLATP